MATDTPSRTAPDLAKQQEELIAVMKASIDPQLLAAVDHAYRGTIDERLVMLDISYEGTTNAQSI